MNRLRRIAALLVTMGGGGGITLPYSIDFSQYAALPSNWAGTGAAISGGRAGDYTNKIPGKLIDQWRFFGLDW